MRIAVVGASGNIGTSLLDALGSDPEVTSVVGIARRPPQAALPKVEWATADVVDDDLVPLLRGADAVVVLAWLIQPSRDLNVTWQTNVVGSMQVFRAAAAAGSTAIVYSSSVGAYSAGPKDRAVGETWPTDGVPTSA